MKQSIPTPVQGFFSALATLMYISIVAWIMIHGEQLFGAQMDGIVGPVMFLLLFVFSATVTGIILLGRPAYLFLTGERKVAVSLLLYTVGWLFVITLAFLFMVMSRGASGSVM